MPSLTVNLQATEDHNRLIIPINDNIENPTITCQKNKIKKILEISSDTLIFTGGILAVAGNGLLWKKALLPAIPAGCFVLDSVVTTGTSGMRIINHKFNKNEIINEILMLTNFASSGFLPYAVFLLNWPLPLKPELSDVWGCFIPAATISTINHTIWISEGFYKLNNNSKQTQVNKFRKTINTLPTILGPIGLTLAFTGVYNMYQHLLNSDTDQEKITAVQQSFIPTMVGIGLIGAGVFCKTLNTIGQIYNSCFPSSKCSNEINNIETIDEQDQPSTNQDVINEYHDEASLLINDEILQIAENESQLKPIRLDTNQSTEIAEEIKEYFQENGYPHIKMQSQDGMNDYLEQH